MRVKDLHLASSSYKIGYLHYLTGWSKRIPTCLNFPPFCYPWTSGSWYPLQDMCHWTWQELFCSTLFVMWLLNKHFPVSSSLVEAQNLHCCPYKCQADDIDDKILRLDEHINEAAKNRRAGAPLRLETCFCSGRPLSRTIVDVAIKRPKSSS